MPVDHSRCQIFGTLSGTPNGSSQGGVCDFNGGITIAKPVVTAPTAVTSSSAGTTSGAFLPPPRVSSRQSDRDRDRLLFT